MAIVSNYVISEDEQIGIVEQTGDDFFINLIRTKPWLYDKSNKSYSDKIMVYNGWKDISIVMKETIENCQTRWSRLKSNYTKERMAREKENKSGSARSNQRSWPPYEQMKTLLKNETQSRHTYSNLPSTSCGNMVQPAQKCASGRKFKKKLKHSPLIESAFNNVNETINTVVGLMQGRTSDQKIASLNNSHKLFGLLVAAELNSFEVDEATRKYKKIIRYLSELD